MVPLHLVQTIEILIPVTQNAKHHRKMLFLECVSDHAKSYAQYRTTYHEEVKSTQGTTGYCKER